MGRKLLAQYIEYPVFAVLAKAREFPSRGVFKFDPPSVHHGTALRQGNDDSLAILEIPQEILELA
jgi:hypothetical protein